MDVMALGVQIQAKGGQEVIRTLEQVDRSGKRAADALNTTSRTVNASFGRMSAVLQDVGREVALFGEVGKRELKQVAASASGLALAFGPTGAIVSAIGFTVTAILTMHGRARREMEETARQHTKTLEELAERGDAIATRTAARRAQREIDQLRARQATLLAAIGNAPAPTFRVGAGGTGGGGGMAVDPFAAQRKELEQIGRQLAQLEPHQRALTEQAALQASHVTTIAARNQEIERAAERRREIEEATARAIKEQRDAVLAQLSKMTAPDKLPSVWENLKQSGALRVEVEVVPQIKSDSMRRDVRERATELAVGIGQAVEDGLTNIASGLFSGDIGGTMLRSLGQFMVQVGKSLVAFGEIVARVADAIRASLLGLGPGAAIAGGLALIALGSALMGMGGGGGGGRGGFYGGGPVGRQPDESRFVLGAPGASIGTGSANAAANVPTARPIVFNATIIGANDPRAQREVVELVRNAAQRGIRP